MYFKNLPRLLYTFEDDNSKALTSATDILFRMAVTREAILNATTYYPYTVKDGERPEHIADKLYDDSEKHWIVLFANQVLDANYEWPLDSHSLDRAINKRYSSVNVSLTDVVGTFTVGESVFQGSETFARAKTIALVESVGANTVRVRSVEGAIANGETIIGSSSNAHATVIAQDWADNGFEWASNTTSHYKVTQTTVNSVDNVEDVREWIVSANTFNHASNTVVAITPGTTSVTVDDVTITTTTAPVTLYDAAVEHNDSLREIVLFPRNIAERIDAEFKQKARKV